MGGRGVDPKAVGDALWTLVLGYLDASLPGKVAYLKYVGPKQGGVILLHFCLPHHSAMMMERTALLNGYYHPTYRTQEMSHIRNTHGPDYC